MYGASIGTLRILEKTGPGNKSESVIWEVSGNFGDQWYSGQAPITSGSPYQVIFVKKKKKARVVFSDCYKWLNEVTAVTPSRLQFDGSQVRITKSVEKFMYDWGWL